MRRSARMVAAALLVACRPANGPQPIVWDREPCAHCRMLISEPRFAAQIEAADGTVSSFDDPGCLLAHLAGQKPDARTLWFHHVREERWIRGDAVAFERVGATPMGFGLGAVDAGAPGALGLEEARAFVTARVGRPEARPGAAP